MGSSITTRGGDAEVDGRVLSGALIEPAELLLGAGQADPETFDLAEPAFRLGFGDAGDQGTLFEVIASLMPGARMVLRRIVEVGGTASYDDVQQYFADHPTDPIPPTRIGGTLTSIKAVQRRVGPLGVHQLLQRDERARLYRIDRVLVEGLQRAYVLADARPDLLRREPPVRGT
ncbi:hypothetical protein ABZ935_26140 [Streptomyces coeruleorubidus]|uniref:hypothetical protein n=1 Tax=Streptomyces coeruleorubidus TaxID=116188 RepID=UPI00340EE785